MSDAGREAVTMGATEVVWPASDKPQGRKSRKKDAELWGFECVVVVWVDAMVFVAAPVC